MKCPQCGITLKWKSINQTDPRFTKRFYNCEPCDKHFFSVEVFGDYYEPPNPKGAGRKKPHPEVKNHRDKPIKKREYAPCPKKTEMNKAKKIELLKAAYARVQASLNKKEDAN